MKKVMIELEDGRVYSIPASVVAKNRADYYAQKDKDTTYEEEYNYTMSDDSELIDWLFNQMDWYDHNPKLEKTASPPALNKASVEATYVSEK